MKYVIATNNFKKLAELERILNPLGIEAIPASQAGMNLEEVEETGTTFAENARLKAESACRITRLPAIADDSGLMVDALGGRPGVYSARYAGEDATDAQRIEKLLEEMLPVSDEERSARFASAICCVYPDGESIDVYGECEGRIAHRPMGEGGFGYDPIFVVEGGLSYAQLSKEEKDKISHRGVALRKLTAEIRKRQNKEDGQ